MGEDVTIQKFEDRNPSRIAMEPENGFRDMRKTKGGNRTMGFIAGRDGGEIPVAKPERPNMGNFDPF
jgi:hypothetical protein